MTAMKKRKGSAAAAVAAPGGRGRGRAPLSVAEAALRFLAALHLIVLSSPAMEASAGKRRVGRGMRGGGLMWAGEMRASLSSLIV